MFGDQIENRMTVEWQTCLFPKINFLIISFCEKKRGGASFHRLPSSITFNYIGILDDANFAKPFRPWGAMLVRLIGESLIRSIPVEDEEIENWKSDRHRNKERIIN